MVSLKKYLESNREELVKSALDSYRAALLAMAESGAQACPHVGRDMQQSLVQLQERVAAADPTPALVKATQQRVEEELRQWGTSAADYFKNKTAEVRDLMLVLARMTETVGERDQKYNRQFSDFQTRLKAIADLEDLTTMRTSLVASARDLKNCVDKMAQDSQESLTQLRGELSSYQKRLQESERLASLDSLTGLSNRRKLEMELEARVVEGRSACIVVLDLNGFKQINDQQGHLAGDQILKQFATELRSSIRATDVLGRWGGDEFLMILDCKLDFAETQVRRIREWAFGQYSIETAAGARKVQVSAAIGVAQLRPGDTASDLLQRADAAMYRQKQEEKGGGL